MLSRFVDAGERLALHVHPEQAARLLKMVPPSAIAALQRIKFQRTLRLVAEKSPFYQEQFERLGIDVRSIRQPADLGDFYTTGEHLRKRLPDFIINRADTAFETTGTTSPVPKRVFFSQREIDQMGHAAAVGLWVLGLRPSDRILSAFDTSFWISPAVVR